jgi:hypothetical protein
VIYLGPPTKKKENAGRNSEVSGGPKIWTPVTREAHLKKYVVSRPGPAPQPPSAEMCSHMHMQPHGAPLKKLVGKL